MFIIRHFLSAKMSFEDWKKFFNHQFYFQNLAQNRTTFIFIMKYSKIWMRIKQIKQKSDLSAKRSTSLHRYHCSIGCTPTTNFLFCFKLCYASRYLKILPSKSMKQETWGVTYLKLVYIHFGNYIRWYKIYIKKHNTSWLNITLSYL